MKQYKYILFDWDGTLARTLDIWLDCMRYSLQKRGHFLQDEEIGANYDAFKKRFEIRGHGHADQLVAEATLLANSKIPDVDLYPYARQILEDLHSYPKKLALVTTSVHAQIDPLLSKHSMTNLFDAVVCGDDTLRIKPDPEPIMKAITALGASPSETLMVGDSESDISAATHAGIDSVLFYPPSHDKFHVIDHLRSLKPTFIIHDLEEIMSIVRDRSHLGR